MVKPLLQKQNIELGGTGANAMSSAANMPYPIAPKGWREGLRSTNPE